MIRQYMYAIVVLALMLVGGPKFVRAGGSPIAEVMKDLRWGMNKNQVALYLKRQLKNEYTAHIKEAKGHEKQRLIQEAKSRIKEIDKSIVEFNGRRTRYDSGLIAQEFTHNNLESIVVARRVNSTDYYFFIEDSLWKWFKAYEPDAILHGRGKDFGRLMERRFGRGFHKTVKRGPGPEQSDVIEWRDRFTRLHALDRKDKFNRYCLVFEDLSTLSQLSVLRTNPDKRFAHARPQKRQKSHRSSSTYQTVSAKPVPAKLVDHQNKSVFANEGRDETQEQYEARRQRILEQKRRAQEETFERRRAAKRAKVLDSLKGLEDDDPLSGL